MTVADARFSKPLDLDLIRSLASEHSVLITVEEVSFLFSFMVIHMYTCTAVHLPQVFNLHVAISRVDVA